MTAGPERTSPGTWILTDPEKVVVAASSQAIAETLAEVDQTRADLHWVTLLNYELGFWFEPKLFHLRDFQHPPLMVICFRSARWLSRLSSFPLRGSFRRELDSYLMRSTG